MSLPRIHLSTLFLSALAACGQPTEDVLPPNVVVITMDTLRADHLGLYGYFRDTSPNLDRLGEQSLVFDACYAPMATTLPSHVSLFTSTHPLEHGVLANMRFGGKRFTPAVGLRTVAQAFKEAHYQTAAFVSASPLKRASGLRAGFGVYEQPEGAQLRGDQTTDSALLWLATVDANTPYFLWVHYFDVHTPHESPPEYLEHFEADAALDAYLAEREFSMTASRVSGETIEARAAVNSYDGEVRYLDEQVRRLLDAVEDDALVLAVGDHGEGLGQHGKAGHGEVWGEQLRVPLFMRIPGRAAQRIETPLSIVDVWPTFVANSDLAHLFPAEGQWSGRNILELGVQSLGVLGQTTGRHLPSGAREQYSFQLDGWKLIHTSGGESKLFRLVSDPFELNNLAQAEPEQLERLTELLEQRLQQERQRALRWVPSTGDELSAEALQELRELGYVGGDEASDSGD